MEVELKIWGRWRWRQVKVHAAGVEEGKRGISEVEQSAM